MKFNFSFCALYFVFFFLVFEVGMAIIFITWYVLLIENMLILADLLVFLAEKVGMYCLEITNLKI